MSKAVYKGTVNLFKDKEALEKMIKEKKSIVRKTFLKNIDSFGIVIPNDEKVKFFHSKFKGKNCYFYVNNKIEHVFIK